jgi:hypothetical protein
MICNVHGHVVQTLLSLQGLPTVTAAECHWCNAPTAGVIAQDSPNGLHMDAAGHTDVQQCAGWCPGW